LIIGDWGFTLIASPWTAIGVLGNILVLVVILTSKSMRSSTNIFLLNLRHFNTTQKLFSQKSLFIGPLDDDILTFLQDFDKEFLGIFSYYKLFTVQL
jgi:hypothetical protein